MLVIVVAMFCSCWLPLHAFILVLDFFPSVGETVSGSTLTYLFISCHWLAMSNSFANSIIYGFTNEIFRMVKMLVVVVAMFGICWLPLHAFILVLDFFPSVDEIVSGSTITSLFISCHWLALSNSFANSIIYGFTNESFRANLVTLFYMWFPCCVCLTKMMPRYSSGSTYETVVFRRQNLHKQGAKFNGTYQTRTVRAQRTSEYFPDRSRTRFEYVDFPCANGKAVVNGKFNLVKNGCGQRVIMSLEKDYVRLKPVDKNSISANSEPSVEKS